MNKKKKSLNFGIFQNKRVIIMLQQHGIRVNDIQKPSIKQLDSRTFTVLRDFN